MSEQQNQPPFAPPVSVFTGPVAELIAQRMLLPPSRPGLLAVLDHFEILRVLGGGGMGIVLLARDSDTGRDVAIKLIKSDLVTNQHVVHRFLKEAGHLKRLRHTNIVPVQEISDRTEGPYFVMPYFEKGSLANRIKPGQPLDIESILDAQHRFEILNGRIRAKTGHRYPVKIPFLPSIPPDLLFHGTSVESLNKIRQQGILRMGKAFVHLSTTRERAFRVGLRKTNEPQIILIKARKAYEAGIRFWRSGQVSPDGEIFLSDEIPPRFIEETHC
jgi:putative RNA 2'-phosphotransferase